MVRTRRWHAAGILACLWVAGSAAGDDDASLEASLEALVDEINSIEKWLGRSDSELQALLDDLEVSDEEVSELGAKLFEAKKEVNRTENLIWDLEIREQQLHRDRQAAWKHSSVQFRNAYHLSRTDSLKIVLNQENPEHLARVLKYSEYYNRALVARLKEFRSIEAELSETISGLKEVRDRLLDRIMELEESRKRFSARRDERQDVISSYNRELGSSAGPAQRRASTRATLSSVVGALQSDQPFQRTMPAPPLGTSQGRFWPVEGRQLTSYGETLAGGRVASEGAFFQADPGTPVFSAADGAVVFSDWIRSVGLLMVIDHGDRYLSLYGSCDSLFKGIGDVVEGGEPIGLVGQSGGQARVGVYFEIRRRGRPLDPTAWLGTRNSSS
ncbi:MAG: peptidoglycan DD-metalloendopeptidase family protein [Pseudomonadales bacterium]|nr:peptidoglycan DD-metalloendopeptidase family protein [Pseudomonadales bacterium]